MGGIFTSWAAFEAAVQEDNLAVVQDTAKDVKETLDEYIGGRFYGSGKGGYDRTDQLKASPQIDGVSSSGNTAVAQISINTGTQYDPAGRDTETIYGYAENDGLVGTGGFFRDTESEVPEQLASNAKKHFG